MTRHWKPADPMGSPSSQLARLTAERDTPRCGVCDKPSTRPLCARCEAVLNREQRPQATRA